MLDENNESEDNWIKYLFPTTCFLTFIVSSSFILVELLLGYNKMGLDK